LQREASPWGREELQPGAREKSGKASKNLISVAEGPHKQPWHESEFCKKSVFIACREELQPGAETTGK
jgi:hypothetical protein